MSARLSLLNKFMEYIREEKRLRLESECEHCGVAMIETINVDDEVFFFFFFKFIFGL